jgi:hypothetical protein
VVLTFDINDILKLDFDAATESLNVWHSGNPVVTVDDYPTLVGLFAPDKKDKVKNRIADIVNDLLGKVRPVPLGSHKKQLAEQLKTLDGPTADAHFTSARFVDVGVILDGRVTLASRNRPVIQFQASDDNNSFVAFSSSAPGGWIEGYNWSWQFDARPEESHTVRDRYVLSRPTKAPRPGIAPPSYSRWGKPILADDKKPLPGLDGTGRMCVEIFGFQVDRITGQHRPFRVRACKRWGYPLSISTAARGSKLWGALRSSAGDGARPREIGIIDLGGAQVDPAAGNSMLFYRGGRFDRQLAEILAAGLEASERTDAGLTILALVDEDAALEGGAELAREVAELSNRIGAHVEVVEDVSRSWTQRLSIPPDEPAFRLIAPNGGFAWFHDGQITPEELGHALNQHLTPSPPPYPRAIGTHLEEAGYVPSNLLGGYRARHNCPPRPLLPPAGIRVAIVFAKAISRPSEQQLAIASQVLEQHGDERLELVVVVDGDESETQELAQKYPRFEVIRDPDGNIADRVGVRIWPTVVAIDEGGIVTGVRQGLYEFDDAASVAGQEDRGPEDPPPRGDAV